MKQLQEQHMLLVTSSRIVCAVSSYGCNRAVAAAQCANMAVVMLDHTCYMEDHRNTQEASEASIDRSASGPSGLKAMHLMEASLCTSSEAHAIHYEQTY
eukprot:5036495-Amphidinium_carterae.2